MDVAEFCEHGNELPGIVKFVEYLDQLKNYSFFKKDSLP
jgi:hypothetical protein